MTPAPTGLLRRFAAILYDTLLLAALWFLATVPFIAIRGGEPVAPGDGVLHFAYQVTLAAVVYVFFAGFWWRKGRTLGMQSWGLQLERRDGRRPTLGDVTVRFFAASLSWAAFGLGFLWQLWDPDRLTWHDRLSATRLMHYPRR